MKRFARRLIARRLERRVQRLIKMHNLKIIAVTGSIGKTSTKLAIAKVLEQKYRVLAHQGNFNSEIGLPLSIFELDVPGQLMNPLAWIKILRRIDAKIKKYPYEVLVLELGVDEPGDMAKFMGYLQPDIGIVTAISLVHLAQFSSIEDLAKEKLQLAHGSKTALLNAEDERVMAEASKLSVPVQTYGINKGDIHFAKLQRQTDLTLAAELVLPTEKTPVQTHYLAEHSLAALAAGAAVGHQLGLPTTLIKQGLEALEPFTGRMRPFKGLNNSTLIDDSYNADPRAVKAALTALYQLPGRRIAILGSMNELGSASQSAHEEIGTAAAQVDELITIGEDARKYLAASAQTAGLAATRIHSFMSPYEAGQYVKTIIQNSDVVLVKGSQNGVFSEEAVALLLADSKDRQHLVRQSAHWQGIKAKAFPDRSPA